MSWLDLFRIKINPNAEARYKSANVKVNPPSLKVTNGPNKTVKGIVSGIILYLNKDHIMEIKKTAKP